MSREIKFRVWLNAVREMRDVNLIDIKNGSVHVDGCYQNTSKLYDIVGDHSVPIMRFTGLFDKNGKEIFEGDIVEVTAMGVGVKGIMSIVFEKGAFRLHPNYSNTSIAFPNEIEVIGNIHENKELLK